CGALLDRCHALPVAGAGLCVLATRSVGGCRLLGIMHLGWCPRVSLFELVLGRMGRPATRSVLVGLRFGVFVWLLSRCSIVPVGCFLSVRCSRPRWRFRFLKLFGC